MKRVEIVLHVEDELQDTNGYPSRPEDRLPVADIESSIRSFFNDAIENQDGTGPWGGLNGAPIYVTRLLRVNVSDV